MVTSSFIILNLFLFYLLSPKSDYALFLGFSDLILVGGMLPSVLQTPSPFPVLADPVLIALVIIINAALCRRSSLDLAKAMSMLFYHATTAYVILGIITRLCSHSAILGESTLVLPMYALHDHRAFSPFFTCARTYTFHVSLSSRMTPRYSTSFVRFSSHLDIRIVRQHQFSSF